MYFLAKLSLWNIDAPTKKTLDKTTFEVYSALEDELNPDDSSDFRFADFDSLDASAFTFGVSEPEKLVAIAKCWNDDIKTALVNATEAVLGLKAGDKWPPEKERVNIDMSNWAALTDLVTAANMAADNFDPDATQAVCVENECGWTTLRHVLPEIMKQDIMEHPENYVLANLHVKSF